MDAERIGIRGWSYGGHMTLHAMFEAPQIFKVGFAGGPVTDWHFYDTIYTERYIGMLPLREEELPGIFTDQECGEAEREAADRPRHRDDNVHYSNTLVLIDELIKAGKYVEVIPFPGRGHGVSDLPAQRVLWNRVTKFFLDNL